MKPQDREYFMMRAGQELDAASQSSGQVRGRHEELADAEPAAEPIQHIIVAA